MCVALRVMCVAEDADALAALKRATVSAEWELTAGAVGEEDALRRLDEDRPHVVVVGGDLGGFVSRALARYPTLRVVADRQASGVAVVVRSPDEIRGAVLGRSAGAPSAPRERGP